MNSDLVLIPSISIHPDKICSYSQVQWFAPHVSHKDNYETRDNSNNEFEHLLKSKRSAMGLVSDNAKRKISRSLDYLLLLSQDKGLHSNYLGRDFTFKIGFVTLTLPSEQIHPDNVIKSKCLNSLLIELKKYHKVKNYIWRAEKQKNGNIHFHILVDKFIPWSKLRDRWNRIIEKLGYVTAYRESMLQFHKGGFQVRQDLLKYWSFKKQIQAYKTGSKNDWNSPNSTDVHSIRKVINLKGYITKYMTKNEDRLKKQLDKIGYNDYKLGFDHKFEMSKAKRKSVKTNYRQQQLFRKNTLVRGRIWGCNTELSNIRGATLDVDGEIWDSLNDVIKNSECRTYHDNYFSVYYIDFRSLSELGGEVLFKYFAKYLMERFGYNYQLSVNF